MRVKIAITTAICYLSICSCIQENLDTNNSQQEIETKRTKTKAGEEYCSLPNPYSLVVMQEIYDTYSDSGIILEPNLLYVRFMPKDSLELKSLIYDYNLEIFDYPLDIELEEGEVYVNNNIPETDLTWVYTTVAPNFEFPNNIAYTVLDECYIPENGETISIATRANTEEVDVEAAAYTLLGYTANNNVTLNSLLPPLATPTGTIEVLDNGNGNRYVPVKGVKIRCHRFVKWGIGYTDESGVYTIDNQFRYNPHYAIVFENSCGFDIWGQYGPIARANHNLGFQSKYGYSDRIVVESDAWKWAAVNNAAYDYYAMCNTTGILLPPEKLLIWVWKDFEGSSAPMLPRLESFIGFSGGIFFVDLAINFFYGIPATLLNQVFKFVLPDITIGTLNSTYKQIYTSVNHELSHASHFSQVGSSYWGEYVSYIMTYGTYGNGRGYNAELCAIGEMWGYTMGAIQMKQYYNLNYNLYPFADPEPWIIPDIFWDFIIGNIFTPSEIYHCLQSNVKTYDDLIAKIYSLYPERAQDVEQIFLSYGIASSVDLPYIDNDTTHYDTRLWNMTLSSYSFYPGNNILLEGVTINNNASVTIQGAGLITIRPPFFLDSGCSMILKHN